MSSQNASRADDDARADAKTPRRERGRARVAALLDAAGAEFAEKGFDAATMTAIAARAGASIGSLYQFFPTKDVLADALLEAYLATLIGDLQQLREEAPTLDAAGLAHRLAPALIAFRTAHPAFAPLVETPGRSLPAAVGVRQRLRGEIAAVLCAKAPGMKTAEAQVRAAVVQQLMKAAIAIHGETSFAHRAAVIDELERMMAGYLEEMFRGADQDSKAAAAKLSRKPLRSR
ncbi:TetR/AcrR family transcriptional regulator [Trinickia dinghuensis]|uniref:TetR/AcrR family transcriptional regulator n=1 Tax=Trinickia dinghuensis TaxID=2291023 RepID=A0A3D8JZU5_9BURK|nr:TetR/AcrR family transcriptional regulator [Trinickia dinghuensis]RDU98410.1 TetR/AcrR family transcriptional regulator [Trinickia dinghuensis]